MALMQTPASERIHIGFFGKRNAGKSSVMNAVTGQNLAVVSPVKGTTTDPVFKTMELLPLGPVMMIDTPGIDDEGELGALRVKKSYQVLNQTNIAILVMDGTLMPDEREEKLIAEFQKRNMPYFLVYNKAELMTQEQRNRQAARDGERTLFVSAQTGEGIYELKERIGSFAVEEEKMLLDGIVKPLDRIVLVIPIDKAAPKGRLILPEQMTIRNALDVGAITTVVRETELEQYLQLCRQQPQLTPDLVITDSQAFGMVSKVVPPDIRLTSFSILMARYKGNLKQAVEGVCQLDKLKEGDQILIAEGCTHHRQCNDIGTVKLPGWIEGYTGKKLKFEFCSGTEFPQELSSYQLIVHCGGCMINEREMKYRLAQAEEQGIAMTNYGILIAYVHGILKRSVEPIQAVAALLENDA